MADTADNEQEPFTPAAIDLDEMAAPDWDEEACEEAEATADEIAEHDPEAAEHLYRQLAAARRKLTHARVTETTSADVLTPSTAPTASAYDPMRLYAQLAHYYHFSDRDIEELHFPRAFAYYREAVRMQEEDAAAQKDALKRARRNAKRGQYGDSADDELSEDAALVSMPRPRAYTGPVTRLVD